MPKMLTSQLQYVHLNSHIDKLEEAIVMEQLGHVLGQWARVGVAFDTPAAATSPDLERLIIYTAQCLPQDPRLFAGAASWLSTYPLFVAKQRLEVLVRQTPAFAHRSELGLLLSTVEQASGTKHFKETVSLCEAADPARPLYDMQNDLPSWRRSAEIEASPLSRQWGLWCQPFEPKRDAIRPARWVIQNNPGYFDRAVLRGDLRLSILLTLRDDPSSGASELQLSKVCGGHRSAVRHALEGLEQACYIRRETFGKRHAVVLNEHAPADAAA